MAVSNGKVLEEVAEVELPEDHEDSDTPVAETTPVRPRRGRRPASANGAILANGSEGGSERVVKASAKARMLGTRINEDKPIFTLSVAAEILALHPRTLRIYEEEGLVIPYRTQTARRRYSQNDIKKFQFIQYLTRTRHVNLAGVKLILDMMEDLKKCGVDVTKTRFADYQNNND